jgi:hypothetical protein
MAPHADQSYSARSRWLLRAPPDGEHVFTAVRQSSATESEANLHVAHVKGGPLYGSALGQTFKFPLRNERQLLGAEADQALTS